MLRRCQRGKQGPASSCRISHRLARAGVVPSGPSAPGHRAECRTRSDTWSRLDEAGSQLADAVGHGQPPGGLLETIAGLPDSVAPVERYCAFPGPEACRQARELFASGSYERFASLVARVSRALTTESYRAGTGWSVTGDHDQAGPDGTGPAGAGAGAGSPARPYFEVLVVEILTPAQERALREEVRSSRRPGDHFVYELVVVPSAEEAVIAVQLNASLQACVIRRRFGAAAGQEEPGLAPFADRRIAGTWRASLPRIGPRSWPAGWRGCVPNSTCT